MSSSAQAASGGELKARMKRAACFWTLWLAMVGGPPVVARFYICDKAVCADMHDGRLQQLEMRIILIFLALA
jgi:hypothetical protein